jgi:hypothetical protein
LDQFNYLSVLLSIIVGLAITQILKGYRGIMLSRSRVQMYWPTLLWSASLLLMNVQSWWTMFSLREVQTWTFAAFAIVLVQTILQYLLAAIALPDFPAGERVDLREHYWGHTRWLFGLLIFVLFVSLAKELVVYGSLPNLPNLLFHLSFIGLAAIALMIRSEGYHKFLAAALATLFCAYIFALYSQLH